MKDLSIIIVSYNTSELTKDCLESIAAAFGKPHQPSIELIIVDNASTDDSVPYLKRLIHKEKYHRLGARLITNSSNLGFGRANNVGVAAADGKYILFLNSDVLIKNVDFKTLVDYMNKHEEVGVLTVKVVLPNGELDMASHRGFPTLWNSFTYFSKLESLLGKIPPFGQIFGGYHMTQFDTNTIHEIDSPSGAFYLTRRDILKKNGGFDESFFMYGEDLDLSFRVKKEGYKIIFYPLFEVLHLKGQSGRKKGDNIVKNKTNKHFFDAMKIFYDKHYSSGGLMIKKRVVHGLINLMQIISP